MTGLEVENLNTNGSSLKDKIIADIKATGPINIAHYMSRCLLDPTQGYYPTRDPLGVDGDFITAPEISQMFGEVLGLWVLQTWRNLGSPSPVQLVEYGPGRGTMMSDILRTARLDPALFHAIQLNLIETSAALEAKQAQTLANCVVPVRWVARLEDVPKGPTIIIGNEYLDCLPIRQFIMKDRFKGADGWVERMIDIHPNNPDKLFYTIANAPISKIDQNLIPHDLDMDTIKDGDLIEVSAGLGQIVDTVHDRFAQENGSALFIDYGPAESEIGDSFQALENHEKTPPLDNPGNADLTARVNFADLRDRASQIDLGVCGPCPQGQFLSRLGIEVRAVSLAKSIKPADGKINPAKEKIARQLHRLCTPEQMGTLFKAICIQSKSLPLALGFGEPEA